MKDTLFTCSVCQNVFGSRHEMSNHVKSSHQSSVKVKYQNGVVAEVKRAEDNTFKCKCGKSVSLPNSLHRHAKICNDASVELSSIAAQNKRLLLSQSRDFWRSKPWWRWDFTNFLKSRSLLLVVYYWVRDFLIGNQIFDKSGNPTLYPRYIKRIDKMTSLSRRKTNS
jgi:uncharacterized C2H2 Zn-finger protein